MVHSGLLDCELLVARVVGLLLLLFLVVVTMVHAVCYPIQMYFSFFMAHSSFAVAGETCMMLQCQSGSTMLFKSLYICICHGVSGNFLSDHLYLGILNWKWAGRRHFVR